MVIMLLPLSFLLLMSTTRADFNSETSLNDASARQNALKINKCCEDKEIMIDSTCRLYAQYNQTKWQPQFKTEDGKDVDMKYYIHVDDVSPKQQDDKQEVTYYRYVNGLPDCETTQMRAIFYFGKSEDELNLLTDGQLRHLIHHEHSSDSIKEDLLTINSFSIHEPITIPEVKEPSSYTHNQNKYCIDKIFMSSTNVTGEYALVCVPEVKINWRDTNFLMNKVINPLFHAVSIVLFLLIAIIYFVLPTLRDLAGNIITTINVCLIVSQAADLVRIFTEFSNHVSFMVTDIILYISLLAAFFWLNSFGFYIWKTFKSRNVFIRVTDVRKYCYYSAVVWSSVILMTVMAICAHFLLDTSTNLNRKTRTQFSSSIILDDMEQDTIGWLGIAIFFTPVAFTILFNIFFYVTTLKVIRRINIYGKIHHKLKGCFDLFLQLFLIMTTAWLFLLLSWLNFDGLIYAHIIVNALQAILVFYVCIIRQAHVTFLLRKSCCYAEPVPTSEWGNEMTHMNSDIY